MSSFKSIAQLASATVAVGLLSGCRFDGSGVGYDLPNIEDAPLTELTSSERELIFEDPGNIAVYHGFGCAESNQPGRENVIRVQESQPLPSYATTGTVYLNGWRSKYLDKNHKVNGLGTAIGLIEIVDREIKWDAGGVLSDRNFDDGYSWCYYYTLPVWNQVALSARVNHDDDNKFRNLEDDTTTALTVMSGFLLEDRFQSGERIAVLPRGYGLGWPSGGEDHNLLQLAYNLDYSERFIEQDKAYGQATPTLPSPASFINAGFVSWDSKTVFKDNRSKRHYSAAELVSALSGRQVDIVQPPYSILPREEVGGGIFNPSSCLGPPTGVKTKEHVIENVPFEYAMPVLTGWDLFYACDDNKVREVGVWIPDFEYEKLPDSEVGTLRYTVESILEDDSGNGHFFNNRVSILGLAPIVGEGRPDVVITNPQSSALLSPDELVTLEGNASDPEDGVLAGSSLRWSSDRDSFLGTGNALQVMLSGPETRCDPDFVVHEIGLTATDSDGNQTNTQTSLKVGTIC